MLHEVGHNVGLRHNFEASYDALNYKREFWDIEGLKVEALAAPAELIPTSGLSIAADDELYKGIWRPILKSTGPKPPSAMLFSDNVMTASGVGLV